MKTEKQLLNFLKGIGFRDAYVIPEIRLCVVPFSQHVATVTSPFNDKAADAVYHCHSCGDVVVPTDHGWWCIPCGIEFEKAVGAFRNPLATMLREDMSDAIETWAKRTFNTVRMDTEGGFFTLKY